MAGVWKAHSHAQSPVPQGAAMASHPPEIPPSPSQFLMPVGTPGILLVCPAIKDIKLIMGYRKYPPGAEPSLPVNSACLT